MIYLLVVDADAEHANWSEFARIVLHRDPASEVDCTRRCWESHLARAKWVTEIGYRQILEQAVAQEHTSMN